MKKLLSILGLASVLLSQANAQLVITEVMSVSSHAGGSGNGDWFEIYNTSASAIDLSGWSWDDDSATAGTHSFGSISIAAGGFVLVVDENASLIGHWASDVWGLTPSVNLVVVGNAVGGFSGFGNGGDSIFIYDGGDVEITSITFGSATSGRSFAWDTSGTSLGLSTNGVGGAYTAFLDGNDGGADDNPSLYGAGSDIASPGSAVPEPTAAMLLGGAGMMLWMLRRRRVQA